MFITHVCHEWCKYWLPSLPKSRFTLENFSKDQLTTFNISSTQKLCFRDWKRFGTRCWNLLECGKNNLIFLGCRKLKDLRFGETKNMLKLFPRKIWCLIKISKEIRKRQKKHSKIKGGVSEIDKEKLVRESIVWNVEVFLKSEIEMQESSART